MLPYWIFFILPAVIALSSAPRINVRADGTIPVRIDSAWMFTILILTVVVGFRYEVGGDWGNYFRYLFGAMNLNFTDLVTVEDPGYWALNIISVRFGFGITGVNTLSALIFSTGLVVFCQSLPRPWVALACAMPYLVTVVAMGYTRQSIALGLVMIGLVMLSRRRLVAFAVWVLLGALFHKSAVLIIPIAGLSISKNRWLSLGIAAGATLVGYFVLLEDSADQLIQTYTDANIQSQGALIRLSMNLVPAVLFLIYRNRLVLAPSERKLWSLFSVIAIATFVAFFVTNLSTALDRMALYIIPLQLFVFSHIPDAFRKYRSRNQNITIWIILYYALAMFVWLNFANHSSYWLPYSIGIA
ncbi:EpsG family protein [Hoeflea sp. WL0058]|uniref:EpsG family protein n=1 Tax=Flavimaribacter sediminis TaxID=2865987 RepID=A0AAE2ZMR1_9HYPH|nr:EpsG family protein [Flavimaribacter sediminis]MBW8636197.1 EpsG family protein [Flavimaribacter sediminis]